MWTTRLTQAAPSTPGARNVVLSRDDLTFVISLDDWWLMSAIQHLADKALKENDLNFKMRELYGPPRTEHPLWTTEMVQTSDGHDVHLLHSGSTVATFSLAEFAGLSATEFVVEDAVEVAEGLAQYGDNIEEVQEHINEEFGDQDKDDDDPPRAPVAKPSDSGIPAQQGLFVACRVLSTKSERHDYVVLRDSELPRRHDVEAASRKFATKAEAEAEIKRLGGAIPPGFALFLDFFDDDDLEVVWCWKDERTEGASQTFSSEQEAIDALNNNEVVFYGPPD